MRSGGVETKPVCGAEFMETITSVANSRIKRLCALRQKSRERRKEGVFLIEGQRLCQDTPDKFLQEFYITQGLLAEVSGKASGNNQLADRIRQWEKKTFVITNEIAARISDTQTPQGIFAVVSQPSYTKEQILDFDVPLYLLAEDIQDPGNLGTIFRTAEAAGVSAVIMSRGTVDVFNPKTIRSTMSSLFRMPFLYVDDLGEEIRVLRQRGVRVYAAHLGGKRIYTEPDYTGACAFLIGNEGNGLREETARLADEKIIIPMQGQIESLNAAMSAGILMYQAAMERRSKW